LEIVEVKCANCSKKIYVLKDRIKEKMFCTLGCMDSYIDSFRTIDLELTIN
jgi:hypothetical protein